MDENSLQVIYNELRSKILNERYPSGYKLSENVLANEYGCSRTPIREALKRLQSDGFVVIKPKSGTYVRKETRKELIELIEVRAYLEALAVHLCLKHMTKREYKKVEKLKKEMDKLIEEIPINMIRFAQFHYDFHHTIVKSAKNELLLRHFERLNIKSSYLFYQRMDRSEGLKTEEEHELILKFLREKDPRGIDFMKNHLFNKYNLT